VYRTTDPTASTRADGIPDRYAAHRSPSEVTSTVGWSNAVASRYARHHGSAGAAPRNA